MSSMHRLYVAALHVAMKTHSDRFLRNDAFARVAGITNIELNLLEAELLGGLRWRTLVTAVDVRSLVAVATNAALAVRDQQPALPHSRADVDSQKSPVCHLA